MRKAAMQYYQYAFPQKAMVSAMFMLTKTTNELHSIGSTEYLGSRSQLGRNLARESWRAGTTLTKGK